MGEAMAARSIITKEQTAKAKEILGDRNALAIAEALGLADYDPKTMKATCCFHQESTPSLSYNPKNWTMHCFGCGKTVDLISALMERGKTYRQAASELLEMAGVPARVKAAARADAQGALPRKPPALGSDGAAYLAMRRIGAEAALSAGVGEEGGNLAFCYYAPDDELGMVKYRPARKVSKKEPKCWCQPGSPARSLLFNMNKVNAAFPLLVTEGEIDCLSAIEAGWSNAVSVPFGAGNFKWIDECWDWLEQFETIVICADNDEAGGKMESEAARRLGVWRVRIARVPKAVECGSESLPVKDLNEVLFRGGKEAVISLILSAEEAKVESVRDFSDIASEDLGELGGVETGFAELDALLMKLFDGTLTILTGVNGSGKSSFLGQIICNCLEQGKGVFYYSGELSNAQAKSWIELVLAGQRHIEELARGKAVYWRARRQSAGEIGSFYKGMLHIYRDDMGDASDEILASMEQTVRRHGAKLIALDNLTSISLGGADGDKYARQAAFIGRLVAFARKFSVPIILVVHPKKLDTVRKICKMDIQGVSAIIDMAHRIVTVYRVPKQEKDGGGRLGEFDTVVGVLKDRIRGREDESAGFFFDRVSLRFYESEADLDRRFSWDKSESSGPLPYPPPALAGPGPF
jgi:twinkle protein